MTRKIIEDIKIKKRPISKKKELVSEPLLNIEKKIKKNPKPKKIKNKKSFFKKRLSRNPQFKTKKKRHKNFIAILFFIVLFVGLIFWGSVLFEKVSVIITKKHQISNLEQLTLSATRGLKLSVPFEIMIVSDKKTQNILLSKSEEVSIKAKGEVIIYNEYSKKTEKLSAHTYLSDDDGKVYLTDKTLSIPGYTIKDKEIIPGQAIVSVTSFLPGENYNSTSHNFFINAFKGISKYNKIYGKVKVAPTRGAQGLYYSISDKNNNELKVIANSSLKDNLIRKVNSLIPEDYIFYPKASTFNYEIENEILSPTPNADVEILGTLSVILLKEENLTKEIIKKILPKISTKELNTIEISGLHELTFNFTNTNQIIKKELESINFSLTGELDLIWNPDINKLKNNLLGISKDNLSSVFAQDIGIGNASVKIFPPWQKTMPAKSSKVKIQVF